MIRHDVLPICPKYYHQSGVFSPWVLYNYWLENYISIVFNDSPTDDKIYCLIKAKEVSLNKNKKITNYMWNIYKKESAICDIEETTIAAPISLDVLNLLIQIIDNMDWTQPKKQNAFRLILYFYYTCFGHNGLCKGTNEQIGKELGLSRQVISEYIDILVSKHIIKVFKGGYFNPSQMHNVAPTYIINRNLIDKEYYYRFKNAENDMVYNYFDTPIEDTEDWTAQEDTDCGIYCYRNKENNKCYVGQSRCLSQRKKNERYSNTYFGEELQRLGEDKFEYTVLTYLSPKISNTMLNEYERKYIQEYNAEYNYKSSNDTIKSIDEIRNSYLEMYSEDGEYQVTFDTTYDALSFLYRLENKKSTNFDNIQLVKANNTLLFGHRWKKISKEENINRVYNKKDADFIEKLTPFIKEDFTHRPLVCGENVRYEDIEDVVRRNPTFKNKGLIIRCARGKCNTAYGFTWKFAD